MNARVGAAFLAGAALLASILASVAQADTERAAADASAVRPHILGLVEVPKLFGVVQAGEPAVQVVRRPRAIALRAEPSPASPELHTADRSAQLEAREHGYELLSAVVYGVHEGWYRVRFLEAGADALVWLAPRDAGTYRDLEQLLRDERSHLTADWDRRFFGSANADSPTHAVRSNTPEVAVQVVRTMRVDGVSWFLVLALDPGPCAGDAAEERVVGSGWVPSHAANGEPNLWFYSRGC